MVRIFLLSLIAVLATISLVFAQNKQVSGVVTDAAGTSVAGATVRVEGSSVGTTTGADGKFNIAAPMDGTLAISFIGFIPQKVKISGKTNLKVVLVEDLQAIDEVAVVAFGTKRKQDLVGSVTKVKSDLISNSQATSVSNALEGAVAGLQVVSASGQPGSDANIIIRGIGSLSASNKALIVVDGVPYTGKLSDINSSDIESITVSKDAVSNSLYGARAANGVVMITTKTGKRDRTVVQFQATWGVTQRAYKDYAMVTDPGEFYEQMWFGIRNTQFANGSSLTDAAQYASDNVLKEAGNYNAFLIPVGEHLVGLDGKLNPQATTRYNDTFSDAMFKNSLRQEYIASAAGGTDKTDYYISIGYLDNQSYIIGSSFKRITARANVNSQLSKRLKVGTNIAYGKSTSDGVKENVGVASNPFKVARDWAPIFPVHAYDAAGNVKLDKNGNKIYDNGLAGVTDGAGTRPVSTNHNVIANLYEDINQNVTHNISSHSYIELKLFKDLKFQANYSYDFSNMYLTTYLDPSIGDGMSFGGRGTKSNHNDATSNFNQILSYEKTIDDKHHISAKIGHEYYSYNGDDFTAQKTNFFDPTNPELNNGGNMQYIRSLRINHNIEGYFAMADYNYNNKYYVSGAFRRDGTSRFLNRWGNFWSIGAAWRISTEDFMYDASSWLNELKLRASYGTQGNENILEGYNYAYTPYQDQYEITWNGNALGYSPIFFGNPNLTWEKQNTFDIGLDFRLWDRLYGSIDYFTRKTDDMLFKKTLGISAGRPYNWMNIGAMRNSGIEFELNVDIFKGNDFRWTVTVLGSHYKNKILSLPDENRKDGIVNGDFKMMEGKSRYEYYTYQYAGIDEVGNAQWYMDERDEDGNLTGNKVITKENNKATREYIGKSALPSLNGGFNTSFIWRGIDVSIATAFQIGGWAYDYAYLNGMGSSFYSGHSKDMWNTFDPATGTGKLPIWDANNTSNSYIQNSDAHLVNASYFNIRNLTIGYTFPKTWLNKIDIVGLRVFLSADNLGLWTARQGFDPRVSVHSGNRDFGGYSPMRVISGGVNLTF